MAYELLPQSRNLNKLEDPNKSGGVGKFFEKKNKRNGTLIRDSRTT